MVCRSASPRPSPPWRGSARRRCLVIWLARLQSPPLESGGFSSVVAWRANQLSDRMTAANGSPEARGFVSALGARPAAEVTTPKSGTAAGSKAPRRFRTTKGCLLSERLPRVRKRRRRCALPAQSKTSRSFLAGQSLDGVLEVWAGGNPNQGAAGQQIVERNQIRIGQMNAAE